MRRNRINGIDCRLNKCLLNDQKHFFKTYFFLDFLKLLVSNLVTQIILIAFNVELFNVTLKIISNHNFLVFLNFIVEVMLNTLHVLIT